MKFKDVVMSKRLRFASLVVVASSTTSCYLHSYSMTAQLFVPARCVHNCCRPQSSTTITTSCQQQQQSLSSVTYRRAKQVLTAKLSSSSSSDNNNNNNNMNPSDIPPAEFTTNDTDKAEAAKLQARLRENNAKPNNNNSNATNQRLPSVEIAEGAHKYVLISAELDGDVQNFVTSRKGAAYHRNAADPMVRELERAGYYNINITGGGRISYDKSAKKIAIFGFSYSFGLADHAMSKKLVLEDARYQDCEVTISDEGY